MGVSFKDGMLQTKAGTRYRGLIIPGSGNMPKAVKAHIDALKAQGAHILYNIDARELNTAAKPEPMKAVHGLKAIRRKNDTGYHYFIANLSPDDICDNICLAVPFKKAVWYNPLNGDITPASITGDSIYIDLRSGASMILQTYDNDLKLAASVPQPTHSKAITLTGPWTLTFTDEQPKVGKTFKLDSLQTWETLGDDSAAVMMGTGVYTTKVRLTKRELQGRWQIDLGDVRESARVYINGKFIGCAWSVPFVLDCQNTLKVGDNEIRIEVTNLPANRIADYDRRGIKWRKMEEINVVDINYKRTTYENWEPVPSGLNSEVRLICSY